MARPSTRPTKVSAWPSGQARHSAATNQARRSAVSPIVRLTRSIAPEKSLAGPAQRAEKTPGAPHRAATQKPLSSASAGRLLPRAAAKALMRALPTKSGASSKGSGKPSAPAETTAISCGRSSSASSASLPELWLASTSRVPGSRRRAITPSRSPGAAPRTAPRRLGEQGRASRETAPR